MRKALIYSLSLALILSLTACGQQEPQQEPTSPDPAVTSTQPDISTPEPPADPEPEPAASTPVHVDPEPEPPATPAPEPVVDTPPEVTEPFTEVNETVYATGTVNLRSSYSTQSDKVGGLTKGQSVTRIGVGTGEADGWSKIQLSDGSIVYVSSKYLSTTKPASGGSNTSKPATPPAPSKPSGETSKPSQPSGSGSSDQESLDLIKKAEKNQQKQDLDFSKTDKYGNPIITDPDAV